MQQQQQPQITVGTTLTYDGKQTEVTTAPDYSFGILCVKLKDVPHPVTVQEVMDILNPPVPLPKYNPEQIIMAAGPHCNTYGWTPGTAYNTLRRCREIAGARDDNGYCIYIMSATYNAPVWLASNQYELVKNNATV